MGAETAPKIGRPSIYSDELVDELCFRISTGRTLRSVCDDDDMPDRKTVWRWTADNAIFRHRLARAREASVDVDLDEMRDLGRRTLREKGLDPQRVRVAIDAFDKAARLRAPRKVELTGRDGGPIQTQAFDPAKLAQLSEEELDALERAHRILGLAAGDPGGEGEAEGAGEV